MTVEAQIIAAIGAIAAVTGRVYTDQAPQRPTLPYVTIHQVGGTPINYLRGVPDKRNGRFQINVWGATRGSVNAISRQIEDILRLDNVLLAETTSGLFATFEETTQFYGSQQDFSIWFDS